MNRPLCYHCLNAFIEVVAGVVVGVVVVVAVEVVFFLVVVVVVALSLSQCLH